MIPEEIVQDIISKADIVKVIQEQVQLKKQGVNYTGLCPFHNEKTPSFTVSPAKGLFKCFGCGESGNAIGFVMKTKNIGFVDAIKELGKKYDVAIPEREYTLEEKKENQLRQDILAVNAWAMKFFEDSLAKNKEALGYISGRFEEKEYKQYNIGYADSSFDSLIKASKNAGFSLELLKEASLINQKKDRSFDFYIDRLMFPLISLSGQVLGFTGRIIKDSKFSKYMNSIESVAFKKSKILYGINLAYRQIKETASVIIVEGNTDVMRMQQNGYLNTVAALGTSFTKQHAMEIKRIAKRAIIVMDGDAAGRKSLYKTSFILLKAGVLVQNVVLPKAHDPDTYFKEDRKEWFDKHKKDFIYEYAKSIFKGVDNDPLMRVEAVNEISELLSMVEDKAVRESYTSELAIKLKKHKVNLRVLNSALSKQKKSNDDEKDLEMDSQSLPSYLDDAERRKYHKYGYYEGLAGNDLNQIYFGPGNRSSNFIIIPIHHIRSTFNVRKVFELRNKYNFSVKIEIDMQEMTSLSAFRKVVEGQGNFLLECNEAQFMKIRAKLYDDTVFCDAIDNLGWQKEGFWAWANGIQTQSEFIAIDDNGVVHFKGKNYYIPAFSSIYIEDRTLFMEERKFKLIKPQTNLKEWSELFVKVYGENGMIGIAFWTASLFRDYLLRIFKNFPLLNLFGPKGTGKSQMAMSMMALFGEPQTTANIHNITKPGLADHISRFINAFAWIDEYKNALDFDKIETLKSIYDSIGRSRMNMDKGKKKETTLVNSAVILSGQEMPTADIALFSRVIFLMFTQSEFSMQEKANYDQLKGIEREGLSEFSNLIIQHYGYFEKEFYSNYDGILSELAHKLSNEGVEDRVLRNWATIIASFKTISQKIEVSFSADDLFKVCLKGIKNQARQSSRSDEIGIFWDVFESLFDHDIINSGWEFKIDYCDSVRTKARVINFSAPKHILKFKFSSIASLYSKHGRIMGVKTLPHDTLRTYLENHKYFVGVSKGERFQYIEYSKEEGENLEHKQVTTAYCFDYSKLNVNLEREVETPQIGLKKSE